MCFIFTKYLASPKTVSAMNKAELIEAVQGSLGKDATKRAAEDSVAAVLGAIANGVRTEGKVQLIGFGTFAVKNRKARMGRNPKTGEPMHIAASKSVGFKPSAPLKSSLAAPVEPAPPAPPSDFAPPPAEPTPPGP